MRIARVISQLLLAAITLLIVAFVTSCVEGPPPERDFTARDLFLDASAFPEGWQATEIGKLSGPIFGQAHEYERLSRNFRGPGLTRLENTPVAQQAVYRYGGTRTAAKKFEEMQSSEWKRPPELAYESYTSDSFSMGCDFFGAARKCRAVGQYGEYVVEILIPVYPDSEITYADFEGILAAMEERIAAHFGGGKDLQR